MLERFEDDFGTRYLAASCEKISSFRQAMLKALILSISLHHCDCTYPCPQSSKAVLFDQILEMTLVYVFDIIFNSVSYIVYQE